MTEMIRTKKTNTNIFVLLALNALNKLFDSPKKRTSFKILKTLKSLNARNAVKYWEPAKTSDKYLGIVERRSTIP